MLFSCWASLKKEDLRRIIDILTIGIQLGLTFVLTVCIYMVFALLDYEGGFDSFIGLALFQPIMAVVLAALTIFCCLILGLPIRLIKKVKTWWSRHFYIAIGLTLLGLTLLVLSLTPQFIEETIVTSEGFEMTKEIPNIGLAVAGWLVTAFSVLHTYPPEQLTVKAQSILTKLTGIK